MSSKATEQTISQPNSTKRPRKPMLRRALVGAAGVLAACAIAFLAYASSYYHADENAVAELSGNAKVSVAGEAGSGDIAFLPQDPQAVLVFYPGGKVEYAAYAPLMHKLAERGIACVLVEMPFNLAVFDINAASDARELAALDGLPADVPWFIGGHSLGGSMAAAHLAEHANDYAGLVLLASYSTEDLSSTGIDIVSIYGSEDAVLNAGKYAENRGHLGDDVYELTIDGGNHAQFGSYGAQDGDGVALISADEQLELTADFIAESLLG